MDWNGNLRMPYVSRPAAAAAAADNLNFLYNYDQFPAPAGLEMKQQSTMLMEKNMNMNMNMNMNHNIHMVDPKKKRLSNEQLELLENSFQDEIKLDPDRKMKLAKDLGLQPRQIAVWFQNRRARWKGKQLERLYDALKQEYDAVSRDNQKLQQEVLALRAILKDQVAKNPVSTDISGEETVESTSIPPPTSENHHHLHQIPECNYPPLNMDDVDDDYNNINTVMLLPPYWASTDHMPSCP